MAGISAAKRMVEGLLQPGLSREFAGPNAEREMIDGDDFSLVVDERLGQFVNGNHCRRLSQTTCMKPTVPLHKKGGRLVTRCGRQNRVPPVGEGRSPSFCAEPTTRLTVNRVFFACLRSLTW